MIEDIDLGRITSEAMDILRAEGLDNVVDEEQRAICFQAAKDLARVMMQKITDASNNDIHDMTIKHIKSTLASEATLASILAYEKILHAIGQAISRIAVMALGSMV